MNKNIFCHRKHGVTIKGKFYMHPTVSDIIAGQLERKTKQMEARQQRGKK